MQTTQNYTSLTQVNILSKTLRCLKEYTSDVVCSYKKFNVIWKLININNISVHTFKQKCNIKFSVDKLDGFFMF